MVFLVLSRHAHNVGRKDKTVITRFRIGDDTRVTGRLSYVPEVLSLDFEAQDLEYQKPERELSLVVAETLQLLVKMPEKRVLYAFGYLPPSKIEVERLKIPRFAEGSIFVEEEISEDEEGIGYGTTLSEATPRLDVATGWICIGDDNLGEVILVADSVGIGLLGESLVSVWLRPANFEELVNKSDAQQFSKIRRLIARLTKLGKNG
jgi:hypothetical protein